jgi:Replication-relaxation
MDTLTPVKSRAKWGVRSAEPTPITITSRDLSLLAHLASLRFLTPEQLGKLDGGSEQNVTRCLRALFDHGYVDQVGDPFVKRAYAITRKGARLLNEHGHLVDPTVRWSLKNKRAGARFIDHTLGIADVLASLHVACRGRRDVSLMLEHEIIASAPENTRKAREPLRWTAPGAKPKYGVSSVVSDGVFGLRFADDTAAYFLLELDRGHMPNVRVRSKLEQTSIGRKLGIYYDGWRANRQVEQFGLKQLRVLIVTTSTARVANMIDVVKQMTGGAGSSFFLFIDRNRLVNGDPLQAEWVSGRGEAVRLVD